MSNKKIEFVYPLLSPQHEPLYIQIEMSYSDSAIGAQAKHELDNMAMNMHTNPGSKRGANLRSTQHANLEASMVKLLKKVDEENAALIQENASLIQENASLRQENDALRKEKDAAKEAAKPRPCEVPLFNGPPPDCLRSGSRNYDGYMIGGNGVLIDPTSSILGPQLAVYGTAGWGLNSSRRPENGPWGFVPN